MTNRRRQRVCLAGLLAMSYSGGAFAQTNDAGPPPQKPVASPSSGESMDAQVTGVGDIVVTAQRRSENLQDVPIAITALSSSTLSNAGVTGVQNLQLAVPGLSFAQTAGYSLPRIRGVGTGAAGPGIESSVAVYIDGVYLVSAFAGMLSFNDIAQVAVLKGPQGTLFGRNATGGVVQITTIDPGDTPTFKASATYGNYDTVAGNVFASAPLSDTLAFDVAAYYDRQGDGYGTNQLNGRDVGNHRNYGVRSKLKWTPGETTTVTLSGDYARAAGRLFVQRAAPGATLLTGFRYTGPKYGTSVNVEPRQIISGKGVSLQVKQDIGDLSLVSITAYRRAFINEDIDSDATPLPITGVLLEQRDRQFSQELQLLSSKNSGFTWMLGAFYFDATGQYPFSNVFARAAPFTGPPTVIRNTASQSTKSYAVFGQATYEIAPETNVTAGLRYTSDKRSAVNSRQVTLPNGFALPATSASGTATFNKLTWRLSVDHRFSSELLAYASYNRGFKSGLFDPLTQPLNLVRPEVLDAYEIGVKADLFDRRLRLNIAGFHYDYSQIQVSRVVTGTIFLLNGAGAQVDGVDIDATAKIGSRLTLNAGLSILHDRFTSFDAAVITTPLLSGGNAVSAGSAKGNRLPYSPDWTANASATYTVPTSAGPLAFNLTYFHNDGYYEGPENRLRQKSFNLVNTSIGWTSESGRFNASIWGKNIFNQYYATQMSAQARGDSNVVGDPRTYGVTVGVSF